MKNKNILVFVGIIMIIYYIWFRFIRERLIRDIPFNLNFLSLLFLIYICLLYIIIIVHLLKKKPSSNTFTKLFYFLQKLFIPLFTLDDFIRNNYYLKKMLDPLILYSMTFIKNKLIITKNIVIIEKIRKIYITIIFTPKICMLTLFIFDILNNRLYLIYKYIFISLIELIIIYLIYIFKVSIDNYINDLSKYYMVEIISEDSNTKTYFQDIEDILYDNNRESWFDEEMKIINLDKFLILQTSAIMFDYDLYEYKCHILWELKEYYAKKNNIKDLTQLNYLTPEITTILEKDFYKMLPLIIYNKLWVDVLNFTYSTDIIKKFQIILSCIYLSCWLYILFISFPTIKDFDLILLILSLIIKNYKLFLAIKVGLLYIGLTFLNKNEK